MGESMRDSLKVGDIVIYRSGHSVTVHAADQLHYICSEDGERRTDGRCENWHGECPSKTQWGI